MSEFGQRVRAAREAAGMSQRKLAKAIGITGAAISQWESGQTRADGVAASHIEKAEAVLGLRPGTLIGRGPVRVAEDRPGYLRPIVIWNDAADLDPGAYVQLPRLAYHLSAGNGGPDPAAAEPCESGAAFRADFAAQEGWTPRTHFTMRASGHSMEPTIQDGAPVVIATNQKAIISGKIYAFLVDGEPLLKRLFKLPSGRVRVVSDNRSPEFAEYEADQAEIDVIGRAVWTPTRL